jgi:hypothetical protein
MRFMGVVPEGGEQKMTQLWSAAKDMGTIF